MPQFLSGVLAMGFLIAGGFFLKFWRRTRDRLFACFAAAFVLLAIEQALLSSEGVPSEDQSVIYLLRLAAFLFIIGAIVAKNRAQAR